MKQTTINRILMGAITLMVCSICFLVVCIVTRPRYIDTNEQNTAVIVEVPVDAGLSVASVDNAVAVPASSAEQADTSEDDTDITIQGKTSTRVNIRNAATEDGRVLATVDAGTTFEILEILDNGWTHIIYNDQDAYISSAYVIIINN